MKHRFVVFLLTLVPVQALSQQSVSLEMLIHEALMNNPEILAAEHQMEIRAKQVDQAGSLDDP